MAAFFKYFLICILFVEKFLILIQNSLNQAPESP